jgi:hypothetical protein
VNEREAPSGWNNERGFLNPSRGRPVNPEEETGRGGGDAADCTGRREASPHEDMDFATVL